MYSSPAIHSKLGEPGGHHVKGNMLGKERQIWRVLVPFGNLRILLSEKEKSSYQRLGEGRLNRG